MTGKEWSNLLLILAGVIFVMCLLISPALVDSWASNMAKNHETYNMDKLVAGKIEKTMDCYGYPVTTLSNFDMNKISSFYLFNDLGQHISTQYLREDVTYTLYKIRLVGSFYYLECEGKQ